ncbi:MAG: hypothetical protein BWX66_01090 [Deltaproteobacteria bacterium ADurb.Bin058]|nr:MAG: hypothetical protein BWX66_01090 [Deltaproteobacteria bacterium ADurb.Bin058]
MHQLSLEPTKASFEAAAALSTNCLAAIGRPSADSLSEKSTYAVALASSTGVHMYIASWFSLSRCSKAEVRLCSSFDVIHPERNSMATNASDKFLVMVGHRLQVEMPALFYPPQLFATSS